MKKHIIRIVAAVIVLAMVGAVILGIRYWDAIRIMTTNKNVTGTVEDIPVATPVELPPVKPGPADWTCWRQPDSRGKSAVTAIRTNWAGGLSKNWQVDFLCQGRQSATWSAPLVLGDRVVVSGRSETEDLLFCLRAGDGELLWRSAYPAAAATTFGSGARATPAIDEGRVFTFGRAGDLVCWDLFDGKKIWHRNVTDDGGEKPKWGFSSSPLVWQSLVLVSAGGTARTIAYDKESGEVVWKNGEGPAGYAAIVGITMDDAPTILSFHGRGLSAHLLKDGTELWNVDWKTPYDVNASTPVYDGQHVFITSGYNTGGSLLKVDREQAREVWRNKAIAAQHSDPFIINGYLYGYSGQSMQNRGFFKCVDLVTGEEKWASGEMGWGTGVHVDGFLLNMDIKGNLYLVQPDPAEFRLIAKMPNALGEVDGAAWTVPVVANGTLYLRFKQRLISYQLVPE